jgi:hypothetical protein
MGCPGFDASVKRIGIKRSQLRFQLTAFLLFATRLFLSLGLLARLLSARLRMHGLPPLTLENSSKSGVHSLVSQYCTSQLIFGSNKFVLYTSHL